MQQRQGPAVRHGRSRSARPLATRLRNFGLPRCAPPALASDALVGPLHQADLLLAESCEHSTGCLQDSPCHASTSAAQSSCSVSSATTSTAVQTAVAALQPATTFAAGAASDPGTQAGALAVVAPTTPPSHPRPRLPASDPGKPSAAQLPAWGALALLSLSYMHQACNSFSLPVMLPAISSELHLDDLQGAMLTTGFSYLYALVLLPVGVLCDRLPRPKLLAAGVATWSTLTLVASHAHNFGELLTARIGFAAAQAVQNPISFALIPELFPANKSAALSLYNCAVYFGRALAFGATLAGAQLARISEATTATTAAATATAKATATAAAAGVVKGGAVATAAAAAGTAAAAAGAAAPMIFVPMDQVDLRLVQIVYTAGDYAAVMPTFSYSTFSGAIEDLAAMDPSAVSTEAVRAVVAAAGGSWRDILRWVALPGFLIAVALALALPEPREAKASGGMTSGSGGTVGSSGGMTSSSGGITSGSSGIASSSGGGGGGVEVLRGRLQDGASQTGSQQGDVQAASAAHSQTSGQTTIGQQRRGSTVKQKHGQRHRSSRASRTLRDTSDSKAGQAQAQGLGAAAHTLSEAAATDTSPPVPASTSSAPTSNGGFVALLKTPAFLFTTLAASFNDVGSYALVAWQSTFYERIHHLEPSQYAPVLAAVLPLGGIVGGVGGGWLADFVARGEVNHDPADAIAAAAGTGTGAAAGAGAGAAAGTGAAAGAGSAKGGAATGLQARMRGKAAAQGGVSRRAWVTVGASLAAAPALLVSMTTPDHDQSYLALLVGFALSEAWRAPAANMARSVAPAEMGSSASALYLCIRNLVGGLGPISVALLSQQLGLQQGLLLVPAMYLASGAMFWVAERQFASGPALPSGPR